MSVPAEVVKSAASDTHARPCDDMSDGLWSWVVMAASFGSQMMIGGFLFTSVHFVHSFTKEMHVTLAQGATVPSLMSGFIMMSGPLVGVLVPKIGFRFVSIIGSAIATLGIGCSYFAQSVVALCFTHGIITGCGLGLVYVTSVVVVGFYFTRWRTLATCVAVCGSSAGGFIFEQIFRASNERYGWRGSLLLEAGMALSCALLGLCWRTIPPIIASPIGSLTSIEAGPSNIRISLLQVNKNSPKTKTFDFTLFRSPTLILLMLSGCLGMAPFYIPILYLLDYAKERGVDPATANALLRIISASSFLGRVACGLVGTFKVCDVLWLSNITIALGAVSMLVIGASGSSAFLIACCVVFGLSMAAFFALRPLIVGHLVGMNNLTNAYGLLMFFQGVSAIAGPPVIGFLQEATGSYASVFYVTGSVLLLSALITFPLRLVNRREIRWISDKEEDRLRQEAIERQRMRRKSLVAGNKTQTKP